MLTMWLIETQALPAVCLSLGVICWKALELHLESSHDEICA